MQWEKNVDWVLFENYDCKIEFSDLIKLYKITVEGGKLNKGRVNLRNLGSNISKQAAFLLISEIGCLKIIMHEYFPSMGKGALFYTHFLEEKNQ